MGDLRAFDRAHFEGWSMLAGVDEAGRGALAGPVVAGAVWLEVDVLDTIWAREEMAAVNDSKQLTAAKREVLFEKLMTAVGKGLIHAAAGIGSLAEIEQHNILGANRLAMQRALEAACPEGYSVPMKRGNAPDLFDLKQEGKRIRVLVDGKSMRAFPVEHEGVVKGDGKSFAIALGSIVAKVTRDRLMVELGVRYPGYGLEIHKGYATAKHREAIMRKGATEVHRTLFLRKIEEEKAGAEQMEMR